MASKHRSTHKSSVHRCRLLGLIVATFFAREANLAQIILNGPSGSGLFGNDITVLANGNFVVTDPGFDAPGPITDVGAVYLYRPDGILLSRLTGSNANDRVGVGGVALLSNNNFLVLSSFWNNGEASDAGAVTFMSGITGINGVVSEDNSLVGGRIRDRVGSHYVTMLSNGNYVVNSAWWDDGVFSDVGAVTFGTGTAGVTGVVSAYNSLVGSKAFDNVGGLLDVTPLSNGNYVVRSPNWDNGALPDVGAVTFGSGTNGVVGPVSPENSLVGDSANGAPGYVVDLPNGNYVVVTPAWDNGTIVDAGAVTFASGALGISGYITSSNSLIGSNVGDRVGDINGSHGIVRLRNGNFLVVSPFWRNGSASAAGAVTFVAGNTGIIGSVSPTNSLVGNRTNDQLGSFGVRALTNGNYVVSQPNWDNGALSDVGAAVFGSGTTGITGIVSPSNSLVGSKDADRVGEWITPLINGNYVVASGSWRNGTLQNAGAVTFGLGTKGITGTVSTSNSLVGNKTGDAIGSTHAWALSNGNYLVRSPSWKNGTNARAGAITFGSGTDGIIGVVSQANSLVGSSQDDDVGGHYSCVTELTNGNYVVLSPNWDNGVVSNAGAVTFGSGASGISGPVSAINSLVGTRADDHVGDNHVYPLGAGNYLVLSPAWDNGNLIDAGAATFGSGLFGVSGTVTTSNSLIGSTASDSVGEYATALGNGNYLVTSPGWDNAGIQNAGSITLGLADGSIIGPISAEHSVLGSVENAGSQISEGYDAERNQLVVGQPAANRVVLHRTGHITLTNIIGDTPDPSFAGQAVTFIARVDGFPSAPTDGRVTFRAVSGESCVDNTPNAISNTSTSFSCSMVLPNIGSANVMGEYTGSTAHAYSGSDLETHMVQAPPLFADSFEGQ